MQLEKERNIGSKVLSQENLNTNEESLAAQCTETHANITPRANVRDAQLYHVVDVAIISPNNSSSTSTTAPCDITIPKNVNSRRHQQVNDQTIPSDFVINAETIEHIIDSVEFSTISDCKISHKAGQFISNDLNRHCNVQTNEIKRVYNEYSLYANNELDNTNRKNHIRAFLSLAYPNRDFHNNVHTDIEKSHDVNHIYEEIKMIKESQNTLKYDILDYYEKYSPTTAKTLIDTLFLPRHKICRQCAALQGSPIYSDRLIYFKEPLCAKEVILFQLEDFLYFKYNLPSNSLNAQAYAIQDYMPVCNLVKTNASSIFYLNGPPQDVFDLKSILEPSIFITDNIFSGIANTQLYHRNANNFYCRVSINGSTPMIFQKNRSSTLNAIKSTGYETDLHNWMIYRNDLATLRNLKQNECHPTRSSLLLLEPLLLMPDLANSRQNRAKGGITRSEHLKIIRMMIAYTLAFFLLAIITFYIVYFA